MQNKKNISIVGLGHIGLPMMTILTNVKKKGKHLYNVNVVCVGSVCGNCFLKFVRCMLIFGSCGPSKTQFFH